VDDYRLMIDPLVMESGKRLFVKELACRRGSSKGQVTTTGAILATYATPAK
jgi:hypothetical protein